jgi:tRNA nucleotidyltransferase (CCA-adding enzyme)
MSDVIGETISKAVKICEPSPLELKKLKTVAEQTKAIVTTYNSPKIVSIVLGGSFAKGTWLKKDADIDIFIKISASTGFREFEDLAKRIGFESLRRYRPTIRYSSHPYIEAFVRGVRVNVVPCYDVEKGKWKSAADRSPFHTMYVIDNLDEDKRNQVRLLKKFLKGSGVYGAEIATSGFSGYVAEVLILKFGSFRSVLEEFSNISGREKKHVISIEKPDQDIVKTFNSHLVIIDPVDTRRNLGAAISAESIGRFVLAARAFLERPSLDYFTESLRNTKYSKYAYDHLYQNFVVIEFCYSKRSPDIIWGQLKKSLNALSKQLVLAGFNVIRSACSTDEKKLAAFVFLLESLELWPYRERIGPEVLMRDAADKFISKNRDESILMWIDDDMRIRNLLKRKETFAKPYLNYVLTGHIKSSGITTGLMKDIERSLQIYTGDERKIKGIARDAINKIIVKDVILQYQDKE